MRTRNPTHATPWTFALVASALVAFVASVPAAAPFVDNYGVSGFCVETVTQKNTPATAKGYEYEEALSIDPSGVAFLSPGMFSNYTGLWSKKGEAYSVNFTKSFTPQIKQLLEVLTTATLKKAGYRLLDMHPFDDGLEGRVLISVKSKDAGVKRTATVKGLFFGARV